MRSDVDVLPIRHHISKYTHGGLMARYDRPSHPLAVPSISPYSIFFQGDWSFEATATMTWMCFQSRPTTDFLQGSWAFVEVILGVGRDWKQCEYQCVVTWMCFQSAITARIEQPGGIRIISGRPNGQQPRTVRRPARTENILQKLEVRKYLQVEANSCLSIIESNPHSIIKCYTMSIY